MQRDHLTEEHIYHGAMKPRSHPKADPTITPAEGHNFRSGKTYNHSQGLSCVFRQWRADSHCRFLHGYALKVDIEFESIALDGRNWVVDFGGLKEIKSWLEDAFDHKTLVAKDDPQISIFRELSIAGLIQLIMVDSIGIEAFSYMVFNHVNEWLKQVGEDERVKLLRVTISEHDGNRASYGRV